ncbi:MAG TPA: DUF4262 domain-containing protein [Actinocrinis sp.]|jgi:hypothetical protein
MSFDPASLNAFEQDLWSTMKRHGHAIMGVFGPDGDDDEDDEEEEGDGGPPYAYTVGLSLRDEHGYELVVSGLSLNTMGKILNHLAEHLKSMYASTGARPVEGMEIDHILGGGYPIRLHAADPDGPFGMAVRLTEKHAPMWQAVWPDKQSRFPGEPGYSLGDAQQDFSRPVG